MVNKLVAFYNGDSIQKTRIINAETESEVLKNAQKMFKILCKQYLPNFFNEAKEDQDLHLRWGNYNQGELKLSIIHLDKESVEQKEARHLMASSYSQFEKLADEMSEIDRGMISRMLISSVRDIVRVGMYLEYRYGSGGGDQGHKDAVKRANNAARKVGDAIGDHATRDVDF